MPTLLPSNSLGNSQSTLGSDIDLYNSNLGFTNGLLPPNTNANASLMQSRFNSTGNNPYSVQQQLLPNPYSNNNGLHQHNNFTNNAMQQFEYTKQSMMPPMPAHSLPHVQQQTVTLLTSSLPTNDSPPKSLSASSAVSASSSSNNSSSMVRTQSTEQPLISTAVVTNETGMIPPLSQTPQIANTQISPSTSSISTSVPNGSSIVSSVSSKVGASLLTNAFASLAVSSTATSSSSSSSSAIPLTVTPSSSANATSQSTNNSNGSSTLLSSAIPSTTIASSSNLTNVQTNNTQVKIFLLSKFSISLWKSIMW
jgi:hypothetical protein